MDEFECTVIEQDEGGTCINCSKHTIEDRQARGLKGVKGRIRAMGDGALSQTLHSLILWCCMIIEDYNL